MRSTTIVVAALLLLGAIPVTQAQTDDDVVQDILSTEGVPITFYGHVFNHGRGAPMPMNTQFPAGEDDYSIGNSNPCGTPPPGSGGAANAATGSCEDYDLNEQFFFTTAGFVQAKSREEFLNNGAYGLLHNERGQTKDIYLDTSKNIEATLYMSADFHGWFVFLCDAACWNWDPGYFQDWGVEVWVWHVPLGEHGADASSAPNMNGIANRNADGLTLIANGVSEIKDLASFDETIPADALCGGTCKTVHPFLASLEWDEEFVADGGVIPYTDDIVVEFEWSQFHNGDPEGDKYVLSTPAAGMLWNLNGGEDYPNNVVFPVRNPLDVEVVFPKFVHDKLVILSLINTPWGSYDIDREATRLIVTDENGREVPIDPATLQGGLDLSVSHAGHYLPIEGTWIWDYQTQGLEPGEYTITVEATNFQHSFTTSTSAQFSILDDGTGGETSTGRGGLGSFEENQVKTPDVGGEVPDETLESKGNEKESPGAAPLLMVAALGALALLRRRRA